MSQQDLNEYIKTARETKASDEAIRAQLLKFGWSEAEVNDGLAKKEAQSVALPPPPAPHVGMWVSFQYILLFISLYIAATALAGILNIAVDKNIKDSLDNVSYSYSYGSDFNASLVRGYLAALIVSYPIFVFLFLHLTKQLAAKPFLRGLRARKFLIYLTMVVTFIILISHLIIIIYGGISGTVTGRSIAHLFVTLIVAGSIFGYLLQDVREDRKGV